MKPCKHFKCTDSNTCMFCYSGECTGDGFDASVHCGCDVYEYSIRDACKNKTHKYYKLDRYFKYK